MIRSWGSMLRSVNFSLGAAAPRKSFSAAALLRVADHALYQAKMVGAISRSKPSPTRNSAAIPPLFACLI